MLLKRCLVAAIAIVGVGVTMQAADDPVPPSGNYLFVYNPGSPMEIRNAIIKITSKKNGSIETETIDGGRSKWEVADLKLEGKLIVGDISVGQTKLKFEGMYDPKNPKEVVGSMEDSGRLFRVVFRQVEAGSLTDLKEVQKLPDEVTEVNKTRSAPQVIRAKALREKDAEKKKEILAEMKKVQAESQEKLPGLLVKVVEAHPNTPYSYFSTMDLLASLGTHKTKAEQVAKWADDAIAYAAKHGPKLEQDAITRIAEQLASKEGYAETALKYADKAVSLTAKGTTQQQVRALKALASAQKATKQTDALNATTAKLDKLEVVLDDEYKKTVPPFKPGKYQGRKDASANKVAVMELFTGAQCPPCVAADVAFDALEKAYDHKDLVLIQYHMHIPGPDPLTNLDTIARWDFYRGKFPQQIGGTPSTLFNGKPQAGGGGGMANAKNKFDQYKGIIDPILEEKSDITLSGNAALSGKNVNANVVVAGLKDPSDKVKLHLLLVEEEIRYVGSNGLRFHHQVVRSLFGKPQGVALKDVKDGKVELKVSLEDLQKDLTKYLDDFAKDTPFPYPDRPMSFKGLKVIALVQDDDSREIYQAIQLDVTGQGS